MKDMIFLLVCILILVIVLFLLLIIFVNQKNKLLIKEELINFQNNILNTISKDLDRLNDSTYTKLSTMENRVNDNLINGIKLNNKSYNDVIEQVTKINEAQKSLYTLNDNIASLQNVLSDKKSRGIFGESSLYSILENIYGENNNFYLKQVKLSNGSIADCVIKINDTVGNIVVDSKFPLENYNRLFDENIDNSEYLKRRNVFKKDVLKHINDIKEKYIIENETSYIAFMFIPAESIFSYIYSKFDDIVQESYKAKVYIVSPTTLMAYITFMHSIYIDNMKSKKITLIQNELQKLSKEFSRFDERYETIKKDIERLLKDMDNVSISASKIITKFKYIDSVELKDKNNEDI